MNCLNGFVIESNLRFIRPTLLLIISVAISPWPLPVNRATAQTITTGQTVGQQSVVNGGTLTIQEGAVVTVGAGNAVDDGGLAITYSVNNAGSINSSGGGAINGQGGVGSTVSVTNSGAILGNSGITATTLSRLVNSGSIVGTAGRGLNVGTLTALTNSGTISGSGANFGIQATTIGKLNNSGTINNGVTANNISSLTNSGKIISRTPANFAINETAGVNTVLTLLPGSVIVGMISLGGASNTLVVGNGHSTVSTFNFSPISVDTNGAPFVRTPTQIAVADPSGIASSGNAATDLGDGIFSAISNRLTEAGLPTSENGAAINKHTASLVGANVYSDALGASAEDGQQGDNGSWLKGFGGYRETRANAPSVGSEHLFGGIMIGADQLVTERLRFGIFGGYSRGQVDIDQNNDSIDISSYFAGIYGNAGLDRDNSVSFALTVGRSDHESKRSVANNTVTGGIQIAEAEYSGYLISPEATYLHRMTVFGHSLKPSLRARYSYLYIEKYTETGTGSNLTVNGRALHTIDGRGQVAAPVVEQANKLIELRIGVDGRSGIGSRRVDATLLGQTVTFDPGGRSDAIGGFIGGFLSYKYQADIEFFVSAELGTSTAVSIRADGQAGVKITF